MPYDFSYDKNKLITRSDHNTS